MLDAGCGSSPWHLKVSHARGIALDVDRKNVKEAAEWCARARRTAKELRKSDLSFVVGDIENLPFQRNMFDIIVNCDVLEHVRNPEKAIQELCFSVKKMGKLIVTTSNPANPIIFLDELLPGSTSERILQLFARAYTQMANAHSRERAYYERHHRLSMWNLIKNLRKNGLVLETLLMFGIPPFGYISKCKRHPIESHQMLCCGWIVFDKLTNTRLLKMFKEAMLIIAQKQS
jgi:ubiquinone/menaquinone biosynthesis C-methylase UbiE